MECSLAARILVALVACACLQRVVAAQPLLRPWKAADVGAPAVQGLASIAGDTVTVTGAGSGPSAGRDQFTFVYQLIAGDSSIVARIDGLQGA